MMHRLTATVLLLALLPLAAMSQKSVLWGSAEPGQWDPSFARDYDFYQPIGWKQPRTLAISVWYPTKAFKARRMTYNQYLAYPPGRYTTPDYLAWLENNHREDFCKQLFNRSYIVLGPEGQTFFHQVLRTPTYAHYGAPPAMGPLPLVVYIPDSTHAADSNYLLCERLASQGFLVVSASFFQPTPDSLQRSKEAVIPEDITFLLDYMKRRYKANMTKVAMMGHGYGAIPAMAYAQQWPERVQAVAVLDPLPAQLAWSKYPPTTGLGAALYKNPEWITDPVLVLAPPTANLTLFNRITGPNRYYLLFRNLKAGQYHSAAHLVKRLLVAEGGNSPSVASAKQVLDSYDMASDAVTFFLFSALSEDSGYRAMFPKTLDYLKSLPAQVTVYQKPGANK